MSTLSDLSSFEVIKRLHEKQIVGTDLPISVRLNIVQILRQDKTQAEIAHILGVCDRTVERDVKRLKDESVKLVADVTVDKVAGGLIRAASYLRVQAQKEKNWSLAWRIKCELVDKLQSMGYIHTAAKKIEADITTEVEVGPALIKLLGKNNGDGRTFAESWRDGYRDAARAASN